MSRKPKEHPILFGEPMVRALLAGTKTQTRRIMKARRDRDIGCELAPNELAGEVNEGCLFNAPWQIGDRLWVRETWQMAGGGTGHWYRATDAHADDGESPVSCWRPSIHMPRSASRITLEVTGVRAERLQQISEADAIAEGIERCEDFFGAPCWRCYEDDEEADVVFPDEPIGSFISLWNSIHGAGAWNANPWVWVLSFRSVTS